MTRNQRTGGGIKTHAQATRRSLQGHGWISPEASLSFFLWSTDVCRFDGHTSWWKSSTSTQELWRGIGHRSNNHYFSFLTQEFLWQAAILGPAIFLLRHQWSPRQFNFVLLMYADDVILFKSTERPKIRLATANQDQQPILEWGFQWLVSFISSKKQREFHSRLRKDSYFTVSKSPVVPSC